MSVARALPLLAVLALALPRRARASQLDDETEVNSSGAPRITIPVLVSITGRACGVSEYLGIRAAISHANRRDARFCPAIGDLRNSFEIAYELADAGGTSDGAVAGLARLTAALQDANSTAGVVLGPDTLEGATAASLVPQGPPLLSWAAGPALPPEERFPDFFRVAPPSMRESRTLSLLLVALGFNLFNMLHFYDDGDTSAEAVDLRQAAAAHSLGLNSFSITSGEQHHLSSALAALRGTGIRVMVAICSLHSWLQQCGALWNAALALNMVRSPGWVWLSTSAMGFHRGTASISDPDLFSGTLYVASASDTDRFRRLAAQWEDEVPGSGAPEFSHARPCVGAAGPAGNCSAACGAHVGFAYDALVAAAVMLDQMISRGEAVGDLTPDHWRSELRSGWAFGCLTGLVSLNGEQGRATESTDIRNWHNHTFDPIIGTLAAAASRFEFRVGETVRWPSGAEEQITRRRRLPAVPSGGAPTCPAGTDYNEAEGQCRPCNPGRFDAPAGNDPAEVDATCTRCPIGRFSGVERAMACVRCPVGRHTHELGQSECAHDFVLSVSTPPEYESIVDTFAVDLAKHYNRTIAELYGPPIVEIPNFNELLRIEVRRVSDSSPNLAIDSIRESINVGESVGVVGGSTSMIGASLASVATAFELPMMSYGAVVPTLTSKDFAEYGFFTRTVPSGLSLAAAAADFMAALSVRALTIVHSSSDYGFNVFTDFHAYAHRFLQIGKVTFRYMYQYTARTVERAIDDIGYLFNRVVLFAVELDQMEMMCDALTQNHIFDGSYQLFATEDYGNAPFASRMPTGLLSVRSVYRGDPHSDVHQRFLDLWRRVAGNAAGPDEDDAPWPPPGSVVAGSFLFDAMYTFALAFNGHKNRGEACLRRQCLRELRRVRFPGATGNVSFTRRGDRNLYAYTLENFQPDPDNPENRTSRTLATWRADCQGKPPAICTDAAVEPGNFSVLWMDGSSAATIPEKYSYCSAGMKECGAGARALFTGLCCESCNPGKYSPGGPDADCEDCPEGSYQPERGAASCLECWGKVELWKIMAVPMDEGARTCTAQTDYVISSWTVILLTCLAYAPIFHSICRRVRIANIELNDFKGTKSNSVTITTLGDHMFRPCYKTQTLKVVLEGTCVPELDGKTFRIRHISSRQLELLTVDGVHTTFPSAAASMGTIIMQQFWLEILISKTFFVPRCLWFLIFQLGALTFSFTRVRRSTLYTASIIGVLMAIVTVCLQRLHYFRRRKSPLEKQIHKFRAKTAGRTMRTPPGSHRAISVEDLNIFYVTFQPFIRNRNMHYVVNNIVLPLTRPERTSYAEMVGPKQLEFFISHYWGSAFAHFVETITKHATYSRDSMYRTLRSKNEKWKHVSYWVCSMSNCQWNLSEEVPSNCLEETSFYKAMRSGVCKATCMVLDEQAVPLTRSWCLFEVLQTFLLEKEHSNFEGLLLCTKNGVINKGRPHSYDTIVSLAEKLKNLKMEDASASKANDKMMIDNLVLNNEGGFASMNNLVQVSMHAALTIMKHDLDEKFEDMGVSGETERKTATCETDRYTDTYLRGRTVAFVDSILAISPAGGSSTPGSASPRDVESTADTMERYCRASNVESLRRAETASTVRSL